MPRHRTKSSKKSKSAPRKSAPRGPVLVETRTGAEVNVLPVTEVVTEKTEVTTQPEIEILKPGTLAQALTEPATAVVKPNTKVRRKVIERKRVG